MAKADYQFGNKKFFVKQELTLQDWENGDKIDDLMSKIKVDEKDKKMKASLSVDEVKEIFAMVLVEENGAPINKQEINDKDITVSAAHGVISDFFFICMKCKLSIVKSYSKLTPRLQQQLKELNLSKQN